MDIQILLQSADDLFPKDKGGTSDPYVVVMLDKKKVFHSSIIYKTVNPVWNEVFDVNIKHPVSSLTFHCWDKDHISDDYEGCVMISVSELLKDVNTEFVTKTFNFQAHPDHKTKKISGTLNMGVRIRNIHHKIEFFGRNIDTPVFNNEPALIVEQPVPIVHSNSEVLDLREVGAQLTPSRDSNAECAICFEFEKDCIFLWCGHQAACYKCALMIQNSENALCPICNEKIERIQKVFYT